jgi:hypothetical protein
MLGEVGERHLARRDEGRDASEESNGDEKTGDQFDDAGPPQRPRTGRRRWPMAIGQANRIVEP